MKAKLVVEGKEFDVEISDLELQELFAPKKQTGYERMAKGENYYVNDIYADKVCEKTEQNLQINDQRYESANYYSSKTVAENNARADKLMRQLRRFAVEHREKKLNWYSSETYKYYIRYSHDSNHAFFSVGAEIRGRDFGEIFFDSKETAQLAIDTFHDELIWYFTEYKDSL